MMGIIFLAAFIAVICVIATLNVRRYMAINKDNLILHCIEPVYEWRGDHREPTGECVFDFTDHKGHRVRHVYRHDIARLYNRVMVLCDYKDEREYKKEYREERDLLIKMLGISFGQIFCYRKSGTEKVRENVARYNKVMAEKELEEMGF